MSKSFQSILCVAVLLFTGIGMAAQNALAAGMFPSSKTASDATKKRLAGFIESRNLLSGSQWDITAVDLNNDMIDEFMIREQHCAASNSFCDIIILAQSGAEYISLGKFYARKIMPANQYTHGVRNILVYNDQSNAFKQINVKWNSGASSYTPAEQVSMP